MGPCSQSLFHADSDGACGSLFETPRRSRSVHSDVGSTHSLGVTQSPRPRVGDASISASTAIVALRLNTPTPNKYAHQVRHLQQTCRRQSSKLAAMEAQIIALKSNVNPSLVQWDTSKRYQSICTVMSTAVRKNVGSSSLRSAVIWSGCAVSHQSIRNWEIKCGTSLLACARNFHTTMEQCLSSAVDNGCWVVAAFCYKSDATNTVGSCGTSYQTMVCKSMYTIEHDQRNHFHCCWPD